MRVEEDPWLAGVYGRPAFRIVLGTDRAPGSDECRRAIAERAVGRPAFVYAKIRTDRIDQLTSLTGAGLSVIDCTMTLERQPPSRGASAAPGAGIRLATPDDHAATLDIAERCFVYSRFHLDAKIPHEIGNRVKRDWIENYCLGRRGDRLLVAEHDGRVAGFLAVRVVSEGNTRVAVIDLVGVGKDFQRLGIGEKLVQHFIQSSADADVLRVGTQAANIPSLRLYEKSGFRMSASAFVLHGHVNAA
jgi:ribosomal protein S18 acetylase RimI-like enzyme